MSRIGYIRVSSADQNTSRQLDGTELDRTFVDKTSGKDTDRPQLKAMLSALTPGDEIYVHSMDRLARNLQDLLHLVEEFQKRGVSVRFVKEGIDFHPGERESPMSMLLLQMLGAVAQFERSLILERQREGIAKAKERGAYKGRKPLSPEILKSAKVLVESGLSIAKAAKQLHVSQSALYRYAKKRPSGYDWDIKK